MANQYINQKIYQSIKVSLMSFLKKNMHIREFARWNRIRISVTRQVVLKTLLQIAFCMQCVWYRTMSSRVLEINNWVKKTGVSKTMNFERARGGAGDWLFGPDFLGWCKTTNGLPQCPYMPVWQSVNRACSRVLLVCSRGAASPVQVLAEKQDGKAN